MAEEGKKLEDVELTADQEKFLQAQAGNQGKQEIKAVLNRENEKLLLERADFTEKATIYFKNCKNCEYTIDVTSTKVMIEGCENTTITVNKSIKTEVLEVWKCKNFILKLNTPGKTVQADMCRKLTLDFQHRRFLKQVVWAGVYDLTVKYGDETLSTGFEQMLKTYTDINDQTDQFIIRLKKDKIVEEQIVRLENGYPTTEREAQLFDEKQARDNAAYEEYVRKLLKFRGAGEKLNLAKPEKIGRNETCPCGSKKKYKKCCGSPEALKQKAAEAEIAAKKIAEQLKEEEQKKEEEKKRLEASITEGKKE